MLKIRLYPQQTCHFYDDFSHNLYALPSKKRPFYRSRSFRKENNLPLKIPDHHLIANHYSNVNSTSRFRCKILITELSPKYETNVYDLTTLFVPFLLPPYQLCFFFSFILFLSILTPKINVSIHSTTSKCTSHSLHKKRNKQQSHVFNYSIHHSSYL